MNNPINIQKTKLKSPIVLGTTAAFLLTSWLHFDESNPLHAEENEPFLGAVGRDGTGTILNVNKLDLDGNYHWRQPSNSSITIMNPEDIDVDEDGNIYTAELTGNFQKYSTESGETVWETSTEANFTRNVAYSEQGLYGADSDSIFYRLDTETGDIDWSFELPRAPYDIQVDSDGDIYVATHGGLYKYDQDTREEIWEFSIRFENTLNVLEGPNGTLFVGMDTGEIHSLDKNSGEILETFETEASTIRSFVVDSSGHLYYPYNDTIQRWNPDTGESIWTYSEHEDTVTDLGIDHEGHIYSTSDDEEIHKIHGGTGEKIWSYTELERRWVSLAIGGLESLGGIGSATNPTSPTQHGSTSLEGGNLRLTLGNDTFQFDDITLNEGRTTSNTSLAPVTISDQTGTGDGWKVQVEASPFTQVEPSGGFAEGTGDMTIGGEALTMSPEAIEGLDGASTTGVNLTNETFSIIEEQQTVVSADAGRGIGDYLMTFADDALSLQVPSNTPLIDRANYPEGNTPYETTLQWNIVSGP